MDMPQYRNSSIYLDINLNILTLLIKIINNYIKTINSKFDLSFKFRR